MSEADVEFIAADLAPGDRRSNTFDVASVQARRVLSPHDPLFEAGYAKLWEQFSAAGEIEQRGVLERRLVPREDRTYEMIVVLREGNVVAVRDHQAIVSDASAVVHLSHAWIDSTFRRTGLAGWLRAWPIQTARDCLHRAGASEASPITLLAEMEHPDDSDPSRMIRLRAYEKAGFKKVDPAAFEYWQPDFRPVEQIDDTGGPRPLPFSLIIRRVRRENETNITGFELRRMVELLYRIYASDFREQDMKPLWETLANKAPPDHTRVSLISPSL